MEFSIGIAGRVIGITSLYDEVFRLCKDYLADGSEDFHVTITPHDIEFEREKSKSEAIYEGIMPEEYEDSYLETLAVYRKIAMEMLHFDTFLMHGAVVGIRSERTDAEGKAVLFTAQSGVGKTTHLKLWLDQIPGAFVINGDKPLIRLRDGKMEACGTPWAGKEGLQTNVLLPLNAICFLERGETNVIERVSFMEHYPLLLQQTYRPSDPAAMVKTMELLKKLGESVPLYRLRCTMEKEAAWVAYKGVFAEQR